MKKHKLLREDILPAMASNRKVQRLLNEFMDLLSEYESTELNGEQKCQNAAVLVDHVDSPTLVEDAVPASKERMETGPAVTDKKESTQSPMDVGNSAPTTKSEASFDLPSAIDINLFPQAKDVGS